ncbi:Crp/Fnr family transcriptional regulator, partial [Streptomyces sp. NPDC057927]
MPFLARLESEDRSALLDLGHELSYAPRTVLLHQ